MANKRPDRKAIRRQEAIERQNDRAHRTTDHQIDHLNTRLGGEKDACKERARLYLRLDLEEYARELMQEVEVKI